MNEYKIVYSYSFTKSMPASNLSFIKSMLSSNLSSFTLYFLIITIIIIVVVTVIIIKICFVAKCRVCVESIRDFEAISSRQWKEGELKGEKGQKEARLRELNAALCRANAEITQYNNSLSVYNKKTCLEPVALVKFEQKYPLGTGVQTAYGKGLLIRFRPLDGINEVHIPVYASIALQERELSENRIDFTDPVAVRRLHTKDMHFHVCYLRNIDIEKIQQNVYKTIFTLHYPSKNLDKLREMRVNETSFAAKNLDLFYDRDRYEDIIGALVFTPYGVGRVCNYRKSDGMYTVALKFGVLFTPNKLVRISDIPPPIDSKSRANSWDLTAAVTAKSASVTSAVLSNATSANVEICADGDTNADESSVAAAFKEKQMNEGTHDADDKYMVVTDGNDENKDATIITSGGSSSSSGGGAGISVGHRAVKDEDENESMHDCSGGSSSVSGSSSSSSSNARVRLNSCDSNYTSAVTNHE